MKLSLKVVLPIAILATGFALVTLMVALQEDIEPRPPDVTPPLIRTVLAEPSTFQLRVQAHGTVVPRRESDLVPQVSGAVVWVSPDLVAGGFFEAEQPLVRIDRADYEAALESARASVARAESEYLRAKKERARQSRLANRSVASESAIDDASNAHRVARATLRSARSALERAERDLARTELRAPYAGRVRSEQVDDGQFASRGVPLAKLYAVDYAEIRLPLPDRDLAHLELTLARRTSAADSAAADRSGDDGQADGDSDPAVVLASQTESAPKVIDESPAEATGDPAEESVTDPSEMASPLGSGPAVVLRAEFAGKQHAWTGRIVRTEGELDPKSRMVQVVARVEDPYGAAASDDRPPLAVGLFVAAEIEGRVVEDVFVLPRGALRRSRSGERGHRVLVVDSDSRLRFREVDVLRTEHGRVIVRDGLTPGERVCISPLRAVTDGMRVRVSEDTSTPELAGVSS